MVAEVERKARAGRMRSSPWWYVAVAACLGALALAVWLLAYGTDRGLRFDLGAAHGLDTTGYDIDFFIFSVRIAVPLAVVAVVAAAALGQRRHALAAATALVGASVSCVALKTVLGRLDPLHGDAARGVGEFFPSVHTGAATGAALALTLLARGRWRAPVAFAGSAYVAAVGTASIVAGGHFPSDVAGAVLVAAAWGSLGAAALLLAAGAPGHLLGGEPVLPLVVAGVVAAAAVPLAGLAIDSGWASDNRDSLTALAAVAFLAPATFAAVLAALRTVEAGT